MSVASRLAIVIFGLVAGVSLVVAFELTQHERERYVESKQRAGRMLTELLAASLAPALDFADPEALSSSLGMLAGNREVVNAAVFPADAALAPAVLRRGAPVPTAAERRPGVHAATDHIDIAVVSRSPTQKSLGTAWVRVSLAQENAEFGAVRGRIFWFAFVFSGLVAALLVAVVRRTITSPLRELERAARRLARGELMELGELRRDEVGNLGHTFNHMGRVIREREERIVSVNARLQGLLDTMRQAIVVFDGDGHLATERSRLARELFGDDAGPKTSIVDLLYPPGAPEIEREAFRAWLAEAKKTPPDAFAEIVELAPTELKLRGTAGSERLLELEFRPAVGEDASQRILLLATDVTSQRKLERSAETREREHQRQLDAMRRLLAGGGQVFVRFLASARDRLSHAKLRLARDPALGSEALEAVFGFVHTLRAEARSFDLSHVEQLALGLELELVGLRHAPARSALRQDARPKLELGLAELARELDAAEALFVESSPIGRRVLEQVTVSRADVDELYLRFGDRPDDLGRLASRLASRPFGELIGSLPDAVERWAAREGKRIELSVSGRDALVPAPLSERLGGVLAHLLRNAVAHGVEAPAARTQRGKPETGRIAVSCEEVPDGVIIRVEDDGLGFDLQALTRRANALGKASNGVELAFLPGISTRERADELAGRGVGLGAVRAELKIAGYLVNISTEFGHGATAVISPAPVEEQALASHG